MKRLDRISLQYYEREVLANFEESVITVRYVVDFYIIKLRATPHFRYSNRRRNDAYFSEAHRFGHHPVYYDGIAAEEAVRVFGSVRVRIQWGARKRRGRRHARNEQQDADMLRRGGQRSRGALWAWGRQHPDTLAEDAAAAQTPV